ncbi:hypothetical protein MRX96_007170 [Rhipicephalus microplus]
MKVVLLLIEECHQLARANQLSPTPRRRGFGTANSNDWTTTNPANTATLSADHSPNLTDSSDKTNTIIANMPHNVAPQRGPAGGVDGTRPFSSLVTSRKKLDFLLSESTNFVIFRSSNGAFYEAKQLHLINFWMLAVFQSILQHLFYTCRKNTLCNGDDFWSWWGTLTALSFAAKKEAGPIKTQLSGVLSEDLEEKTFPRIFWCLLQTSTVKAFFVEVDLSPSFEVMDTAKAFRMFNMCSRWSKSSKETQDLRRQVVFTKEADFFFNPKKFCRLHEALEELDNTEGAYNDVDLVIVPPEPAAETDEDELDDNCIEDLG